MRAIKFRAWSKEIKKMYTKICIDESGRVEHAFDDELNHPGTRTEFDCIPMQFTGLHDKNGKEIWEGDILRKTWNHVVFVVEWSDSYGGWVWEPDCDETGGRYKGTEVVGNIYENPELLGEI